MSAETTDVIFGIDLGTTCSAIGWVKEGQPELIEVDGDVLVPSVVAFGQDGEVTVGTRALNQLLVDPERTIRSAKRHMGSEHSWWIDDRELSAWQLASLVLKALVDGAEKTVGLRPKKVVITVPAWFAQAARADTQRAAEEAGLQVMRLINEPTAAALAHAHGQPQERTSLVYDMGGGTFDVSVVHQQGDLVEVRASHGDTHLGGDDVDARLVEFLMGEMQQEDAELHRAVKSSVGARVRLTEAVREAKHELSQVVTAPVRVAFLVEVGGKARHLETEIKREQLNALIEPLLQRSLESVEQVLASSGLAVSAIEDLQLVGGATRMPAVWHLLKDRYGWEGSSAIAPDQVVALGAAIQGAIVAGSRVHGILIDVAPYTLSVGASHGDRYFVASVITPRNSALPSVHMERMGTSHPQQDHVWIPVMQGANKNPLRNVMLGAIEMKGIPPAPAGHNSRPLAVEFRHDLSGMVSIRVTDELSGRSVQSTVVTGGQEASNVREQMRTMICVQGDLIPGDGSDPDPYLDQEPEADRAPDTPDAAGTGPPLQLVGGSAAQGGSDLNEAQYTFDLVLSRRKELFAKHTQIAEELLKLAEDGTQAVKTGQESLALEVFDQVSDQMFEHGVYL